MVGLEARPLYLIEVLLEDMACDGPLPASSSRRLLSQLVIIAMGATHREECILSHGSFIEHGNQIYTSQHQATKPKCTKSVPVFKPGSVIVGPRS